MSEIIKRGEIYYCDLGMAKGSEQSGIRPVLIIQNDKGNKHSPTVIAIPITSKSKNKLPTHVLLNENKFGLPKNSVILAEQVRTIDKSRLISKVGIVDSITLEKVKSSLEISFGLRGELTMDECIFYIYNKNM